MPVPTLTAPAIRLALLLCLFAAGACAGPQQPPAIPPAANYVGKGPQCAGATPPPQAAAQGLTKLEFCDDFSNPSSFDWKGTGNPGFNWYRRYLYNFSQDTKATNEEPESSFTMRDGIFEVHIARNHYSTQLQSAILKDKIPVGYYIDRKAGGWYVEAAIAHPSDINGFGFWSMDMCHMYMWPASCPRYVEPDWYEYWSGGETHSTHVWYLVNNKQTKDNATDCNNWTKVTTFDTNQFQTYGVVTTAAGVHYYRNNQKVAACDTMPWKSEVVAGPRSGGTNVGRYPIYIGAQKGMSFKLDFVRVWVKP